MMLNDVVVVLVLVLVLVLVVVVIHIHIAINHRSTLNQLFVPLDGLRWS